MPAPHASAIKYFTRGGQTFLHNFRMIVQIISRVFLFIFLLFVALTALFFFQSTTDHQRYLGFQWSNAHFTLLINENGTQSFKNLNGKTVSVASKQVMQAPFIRQGVQALWTAFIISALKSGSVSLIALLMIIVWLKRRGQKQTDDQVIKGDTLLESDQLARLIKKKSKTSGLYLGNVPLPKDAERAHMLFHGSTGTGKSVTIRQLLDAIRAKGDRVIIYDKSCDFIRHYYRYDQDVILNPLDERGAAWHLWDECREAPDYDNLANALMPMPAGTADPFWVNAARTIFSAAAYAIRNNPERSTRKLLQTLLTADLNSINTILKGTEAETLVSEKTEKTAISIKSVLATYLKSLKYVKDTQPAFSIRRWIQDDKQSNWLFISSLADQHETLKPLISLWLDIAANALMSLEPSSTRRIWLVLDELTSLHKLPYLNSAFAEARKFGGCLVIGIQSIAQLRNIYGRDGAEEISGLCNTRVFFRSPTSDTAAWVSKELGLCEIEEVREGYSYGEDSMRAGVSVSHQHTQRPLVNYSEIMALENLHTYLRLPGNWPITQLTIPYASKKTRVKPFIPREIPAASLADIDALIDKCIAEGAQLISPPLPITPTESEETAPSRPKIDLATEMR